MYRYSTVDRPPVPPDAAERALTHGLYALCAVDGDGVPIGCGRVVGDGGL
jgi:hypothetical protein